MNPWVDKTSTAIRKDLAKWHSLAAKMKFTAKLDENAKALITLKEKHNITPRVFSKEIWDKIGQLSEEAVSEIGNSDKTTRAIYDSYIKARNSYRTWTEISDGAYITARAAALAPLMAADIVKVAESGVGDRDDVVRLESAGYDAVLVGESLLVSDDPGAAVKQLRGG